MRNKIFYMRIFFLCYTTYVTGCTRNELQWREAEASEAVLRSAPASKRGWSSWDGYLRQNCITNSLLAFVIAMQHSCDWNTLQLWQTRHRFLRTRLRKCLCEAFNLYHARRCVDLKLLKWSRTILQSSQYRQIQTLARIASKDSGTTQQAVSVSAETAKEQIHIVQICTPP